MLHRRPESSSDNAHWKPSERVDEFYQVVKGIESRIKKHWPWTRLVADNLLGQPSVSVHTVPMLEHLR